MQSPMAQETPAPALSPFPGGGPAFQVSTDSNFVAKPANRDQEIESDWSDVEERPPKQAIAAPMELEDGPSGEIKSKHEIKLHPFAQAESDSQRETR